MSVSPSIYQALITSEHQTAPKFMATVAAITQPSCDQQNQMAQFVTLFDLDKATGDQLDKLGQWIGVSRNLKQVIDGVSTLDDATYRVLLKLYVAMNTWDGNVPGMYAIWQQTLQQYLGPILVQDNQDMTMTIFLFDPPSGLLGDLITTPGIFTLRPAGVGLSTNFFEPSVPGAPAFGFDVETSEISGFDVGAWIIPV
jgi:hypothetical protein